MRSTGASETIFASGQGRDHCARETVVEALCRAYIPDVRSERSHFLIDEAELSPGTPFAAGHEELAFAILEIGQSPPSMFMRAKAAMVNDPEQGAIAEAVYSSEECRYLLVR